MEGLQIYLNIHLINNTNHSFKCNHDATAYMQSRIVFRLLPKDTRPYPYTLPIQSLHRVKFWVFHPRNLTPFLIRPLSGHSIFIFFPFCPHQHLVILISISYNHFFNFSFSSHYHNAYEVQLNHILTSIIFQDIILFTLIMFHNFQ